MNNDERCNKLINELLELVEHRPSIPELSRTNVENDTELVEQWHKSHVAWNVEYEAKMSEIKMFMAENPEFAEREI